MSQSLTKSGQQLDQIHSLLIPLKDKQLLLPNVSVAEIVPFSHLLTTSSNAEWILGRIEWRGVSLPVLCYEMLSQQTPPAPNPNARFAIINGIGGHQELPFYALLIQGIPRLVRIHENDIQEVEALNKGEYDACAVTLGQNESAMVPDLEQVEKILLTAL